MAACDHYERSFQRALLQIILLSFLFFSFEDAFTDSLQIKVSFFFHTQRPKSSVAVHTRMQKGQRLKFTERRSDRKREREVKRGGRSTTEEKNKTKKRKKASSSGCGKCISCSKWTYPFLPGCFATLWMAPPLL